MKNAIQYVNDEIVTLKTSRDEEIQKRDAMIEEFNARISSLDSKITEAEQVLELHKITSDAKDKTLVSARVLEVFKESNPEFVDGEEVRKYTDSLSTSDSQLVGQKVRYSAFPGDLYMIPEALQEIDNTHQVAAPFLGEAPLEYEVHNQEPLTVSEPAINDQVQEDYSFAPIDVEPQDIEFNAPEVNVEPVQETNSFVEPNIDSAAEVDDLLKNYVFDVSPAEVNLTDVNSFIQPVEEPSYDPQVLMSNFTAEDVVNGNQVSPTRQKVIAIEEVREQSLGRRVA